MKAEEKPHHRLAGTFVESCKCSLTGSAEEYVVVTVKHEKGYLLSLHVESSLFVGEVR